MNLPKQYIDSLQNVTNLDIEKLENSFNQTAKKGVRFNTKKLPFDEISTENIKDFLSQCGYENQITPIPWCKEGFLFDENQKLGKSLLHEMGVFYIQEPSATSPVEFLNVQKNDVVLDLCSAPGGKSTQIAGKLDGGFLIANEIVPQRAKVLCENVQRLGFDNVVVTNHSPKELENRFENFFDKILVDAPCSGEGMFRKNNDAINEWTPNSPKECAERQKGIVKSAYKMLKPNGTMVYSTCTFSLEENEQVVKFLLDEFDDLEVLPVEHKKFNFENGIVLNGENQLSNCARIYPYNVDGEGHFFAVLHKKAINQNIENKSYSKKANKNVKLKSFDLQRIKNFEEFNKKYITKRYDNFVFVGDYLYSNCPVDIDKLKVLNVGLLLGEFKKDNFVPSLHLAHSLKTTEFLQVQEISLDDAKKYLQGLEIDAKFESGWVLLSHKNLPICFGKCVNGKVKNHYPKMLRKMI